MALLLLLLTDLDAAAAAKNRNMWMRKGTKEGGGSGDAGGLMRLTTSEGSSGVEALRPPGEAAFPRY